MEIGAAQSEGLRSRLRSTLLEMQTDVDVVDDVIQGFEKRLESILNRLERLEERVKKLEELLGDGGDH